MIVRLLDDLRQADSPGGVLGLFTVGPDRTVRLTLDQNYIGIKQISVHGGQRAWDFELGVGNGAATLNSVQVIRAGKQ